MEHIGEFICAKRKEAGLTQKDIADALGVSNKAVSKWETGDNAPGIDLLLPLSDLLHVGAEELLSFGNRMKQPRPLPEEKKVTRAYYNGLRANHEGVLTGNITFRYLTKHIYMLLGLCALLAGYFCAILLIDNDSHNGLFSSLYMFCILAAGATFVYNLLINAKARAMIRDAELRQMRFLQHKLAGKYALLRNIMFFCFALFAVAWIWHIATSTYVLSDELFFIYPTRIEHELYRLREVFLSAVPCLVAIAFVIWHILTSKQKGSVGLKRVLDIFLLTASVLFLFTYFIMIETNADFGYYRTLLTSGMKIAVSVWIVVLFLYSILHTAALGKTNSSDKASIIVRFYCLIPLCMAANYIIQLFRHNRFQNIELQYVFLALAGAAALFVFVCSILNLCTKIRTKQIAANDILLVIETALMLVLVGIEITVIILNYYGIGNIDGPEFIRRDFTFMPDNFLFMPLLLLLRSLFSIFLKSSKLGHSKKSQNIVA